MAPNPDFKGTPLFDVEYLTNDTGYTRDYYIPLTERDNVTVELCHRQLHWPTFKIISAVSLKISVAYFSSVLQKNWGKLKKDDIARDFQWPLDVISDTINGFIVCIWNICKSLFTILMVAQQQ